MIRLVFAGLLTIVVLAPLPFASNRPWSWTALSLAVGLLLVLWSLAAWRDHGAIAVSWRRLWPLVAMFAAVAFWIAAQASPWTPAAWHHPVWAEASAALGVPLDGAISIDPERTLVALMRLLAYGGVFWLALQLGRDEKRARVVLSTVAWTGVAYSVYGLVIEFGGYNTILWYERWAYADSLTSTFVNRNSFASYAGLALLATLGLLFEEVRKGAGDGFLALPGGRWLLERLPGRLGLLLLMAATLASALLLTGSRGGMIAFVVGMLVLAAAFTMHRRSRPLIVVSVLAISVLSFGAILWLSGQTVLSRFDDTVLELEERPTVYALTAGAILRDPWLGIGYGTFEYGFPLIRAESIKNDLVYDKAHNSYLEFAYEAGVPAFAIMMGLLGALAAMCLNGLSRRYENRVFPCVGIAAMALTAAHSLVDFSLQIPAVAVTFAVLLGIACAQGLRHRHHHHRAAGQEPAT